MITTQIEGTLFVNVWRRIWIFKKHVSQARVPFNVTVDTEVNEYEEIKAAILAQTYSEIAESLAKANPKFGADISHYTIKTSFGSDVVSDAGVACCNDVDTVCPDCGCE